MLNLYDKHDIELVEEHIDQIMKNANKKKCQLLNHIEMKLMQVLKLF